MEALSSTRAKPRTIKVPSVHAQGSIVHIGARGGYIPFRFPEQFDTSLEITMIDGAEEASSCLPVLQNGRLFCGRANFLNRIIGKYEQEIVFNHTACPYAAGYKTLSPKFAEWFSFGNGDCDYILREAHHPLRKELSKSIDLDSLCRSGHLLDLPTILSIDAQGASLDILTGAEQFVSKCVHVIVCESELIDFYGEGPSFAPILSVLSGWGFNFFGFLPQPTTWGSPTRRPLGQRGRNHRGSEDAIFVRDIRTLDRFDQSHKIAYSVYAHFFGFVDCGTLVAEKLEKIDPTEKDIFRAFVCAIKESLPLNTRFPPSFSERASGRRVRASDALVGGKTGRLLRAFIRLADIVDPHYPLFGKSKYEKTLAIWGMKELANEVQNFRKTQSKSWL